MAGISLPFSSLSSQTPRVFTELAHQRSLSEKLAVQGAVSLDDPGLLAFIPRPAKALMLVFPTTGLYEGQAAEDEGKA